MPRGAGAHEVFRKAAARGGNLGLLLEGSEPIQSSPEWGTKIGPMAEPGEAAPAGLAKKDLENEVELEKEKEEKEKEEKEKEEAKEKKEERASVPIAALMLMGVVASTTILALMHSTAPRVAPRTLLMVDNIIAIFLAVLWFQGMDDMLNALIPKAFHVELVFFHTVVVMILAFATAWALKDRTKGIAIFCGAGAHYCAFSGRSWALQLQEGHYSMAPIWCTLGLFAVVVCFGVFGTALYMLKRACGIRPGEESEDEGRNRFMDRFDDVENDFAALSLASYTVVLILFWITQKYPEETEVEPGQGYKHEGHERLAMLLTSIAALVVGAVAMPTLQKLKGKGYIKGRLFGIFVSYVCILSVFSFLLFGEMHIYAHPHVNGSPLFIRILFAGGCSFMAFGGMIILSILGKTGSGVVLVLKSLGLMVGFAWEEAFDAAVDIAAEGSGYGHIAKGALCLAIVAAILPSYLSYKQYALQAEQDEVEG